MYPFMNHKFSTKQTIGINIAIIGFADWMLPVWGQSMSSFVVQQK